MSLLCPDVLAFPESPEAAPDRWVLYNAFARTALGVGPEVFDVLGAVDDAGRFAGRTFRTWSIARFSHIDGLLADPSRFKRDAVTWGEPQTVEYAALLQLLKKQVLVIDDLAAYRARFQPKRSLLDSERFGNYHQQLGQHLRIIERVDSAEWWLKQKFTPDLERIREDTLYATVQDRFLDTYLPQRLKPGQTVLDLGCGAGVIAKKMAATGAEVFGVDPDAKYIELASRRAAPNLRFEAREIGKRGALDDLPAASFDFVFMSDALLFYFVSYGPEQTADLDILLADLRRLLKPGGTFISLEPHPVFYLQPWLGAADRPFTIATEYLQTQWRINPPLARLAKPFLQAGFSITGMDELRADPDDTRAGVRAAHFAAEFPVWLLLEMRLDT
jgi:SAM-dependent methyltransferase